MTIEVAIHNLYALKLRSKLTSDKKALDLAIKALEQTRWISVSERLPEILHEFKVWGYEGKESDQVLVYGNVRDSTEKYYGTGRYIIGYDHESKEENKEWSDCEGEGYLLDVIAWMPIPPYKEDEG